MKAGGGGSGDGSGDGSGGGGGAGGDGDGNTGDGSGDGKNGGEGCGDPVCPITGRVFLELLDFTFSAPMPLKWIRQYNSRMGHVDGELGRGWTHTYGWRLRERRRTAEILDDGLRVQSFDLAQVDAGATNPLGYKLTRHADSYVLVDRDRVTREFGPLCDDGSRHLVRVRDRNGNTISFERDDSGRLLRMRDDAGRPYRVHTNAARRIERIEVATDAGGSAWMEVARYVYDDRGHLVAFTDAEGFVGRYLYQHDLLVRHEAPSNPAYVYRYDGADHRARCIETWGEDAGGRMPGCVLPKTVGHAKGIFYQRFTYDAPTRYCEVEDGLGGTRRFFGDELGRVVKEVTESGGVITAGFGADGNVTQRIHTDGSGQLIHSEDGRPTGFLSTSDDSIATTVDEEGFQVAVYSDADGQRAAVRRRYDERGNLRVIVHHDGSRESFDFDDRGLITRWFDRRGAVTQYFHDAMGNCTSVVLPGGKSLRLDFDYLGRRIRHVDEAGRETTWKWDRRNEPVEKRAHGGYLLRIEYDGQRRPLFMDVNGRVTRFEWGGQGWLVATIEPSGAETRYAYDPHGALRQVINARGQVFTIDLDYARRCSSWRTFEALDYAASYDVSDRVTRVRDPIGTCNLEYDDASRLTTVETAEGSRAEFTYKGRGGPSKITGGFAPIERYLDAFGRVHGEKLGEHVLRVLWSAGAAVALESDVGVPVRYHFDVTGRLDKVTVGASERLVDRDVGGDLLTYLGQDLVLRRRFGANGRLAYQGIARRSAGATEEEIGQPGAPGTTLFIEYGYDARSNLVTERRSDGRAIDYELTPNGQVAVRRVHRGGRTETEETLDYDPIGMPIPTGASYDALGRPASYRGESFEYDALGRLVRRATDAGVWTYEWNGLDQLVRVRAPEHVVEMDYDARGRRIRKRVLRAGEIVSRTSWVWNNNIVIHEVDELAGATRTYDRVDGSWETYGHVDRRRDGERAVYYLLCPGGSVDLAVGEDGTIVWEADHTIYGHREQVRSQVSISARFPNQFYDEDVELAYTWHRWYDARLGQFVTPDPLFLEGSFHPRGFAQNPLEEFDPTGWYQIPAGQNPAQHMASPGPNAQAGTAQTPGSVACPPSMFNRSQRAPASVQAQVDAAGYAYGCHHCGSTNPGTKSGHFVADHQPPLSTFPNGTPPPGASISLYPHCINCSRMQGGLMSHHSQQPGVGANPPAAPP